MPEEALDEKGFDQTSGISVFLFAICVSVVNLGLKLTHDRLPG